MKQPAFPSFFKDLLDQPLNTLVDDAQAEGRKAVAYTCSYVPAPILNVDGLFAVINAWGPCRDGTALPGALRARARIGIPGCRRR